jgi:two-component system chemotaxis response regulator CheY
MNQKSSSATAGVSVLIVDDQPIARKAIRRILEKDGSESIFEAGSVHESLQILESELIEFVIVDMNLVDEKGTAICEFVRQKDIANDVPILVVTGEAEREEIVRAVDFGANDYLLKPFHAEDLLSKFKHLVGTYQKPDEVSRLLRNAERLLVGQRPTEALMYIDQALDLDKKSQKAMQLKALSMFKLGQLDESMRYIQEVSNANPNSFRSQRLLADIHLRRGNKESAIQHLQSELQLNPRSPNRQSLLGSLMLENSRFDEAIQHFREALKIENRKPEALFGMAQAMFAQENTEKTLYYIKRIRRHHPKHRNALELAMSVAAKFDVKRQVELLLRDERAQHPDRLDVYQYLSRFYVATGDEEKLAEVQKQIAATFPEDPEAKMTLGDLAARFKKFDEAVLHYRAAAVLGRSREAYKKLAKVLMQLKKWRDAEQAASALFQLKAGKEALRLLAELSFKSGNPTQAHLMYRVLAAAAPGEELPPAAKKASEMVSRRKNAKLGLAS